MAISERFSWVTVNVSYESGKPKLYATARNHKWEENAPTYKVEAAEKLVIAATLYPKFATIDAFAEGWRKGTRAVREEVRRQEVRQQDQMGFLIPMHHRLI